MYLSVGISLTSCYPLVIFPNSFHPWDTNWGPKPMTTVQKKKTWSFYELNCNKKTTVCIDHSPRHQGYLPLNQNYNQWCWAPQAIQISLHLLPALILPVDHTILWNKWNKISWLCIHKMNTQKNCFDYNISRLAYNYMNVSVLKNTSFPHSPKSIRE